MAATGEGVGRNETVYVAREDGAHVGSYAGRVCCGGATPAKGMGLRSKLQLECR